MNSSNTHLSITGGAMSELDRAARGEKIPWWTQLPAPIIKKDNVATYAQLLDKVEAALKR